MEVIITTAEQSLTAKLIGRLDTPSSQEVSQKLEPLMENADKELILDCTEMSYISSSGLRILLSLRKQAAAKGGKVIILNINDEIRQVFMMTGFLNLFEIKNA